MTSQHDVREKRAALEQIESAPTKRSYKDRPEIARYYLWYVSEWHDPPVPFPKMFGMPRTSYLQLVKDLKLNDAFQVWHSKNHDAENEPVELLLLGCLRVLKNVRTNDISVLERVNEENFLDIYNMIDIEPDMLLQFFQYFLLSGFSDLYSKYVQSSSFVITADMLEHLNNFVKAGLFGILETKMKKRIRELRRRAA
jgi:hypothetical protein